MKAFTEKVPYIIFIVSLLATLTSLFFSEVLKLVPCELCWYQRICMFPIVLISAVSIMRKDKAVADYILPLSILGFVIALYHNLLFYKVIPETIAPCVQGIPCTDKQNELYGFITIPLLSMLTFALITGVVIIYKRFTKKHV